MKTKRIALIGMLAALALRAAGADSAALLQQGLVEEQANRNLEAAISNYLAVAAQFDKDRPLAATAVYRLGECYRAQGKTNEAALQYQKVLNEFSDQQTLATLSRQNLAGMGVAATAPSGSGNGDAELLAKIRMVPAESRMLIVPQLVNNPILNHLIENQFNAGAKLQMARDEFGEKSPEFKSAAAALTALEKEISETISAIEAALALRVGGVPPKEPPPASGEADSDGAEIKRLQRLLKDSPDLVDGWQLKQAVLRGSPRLAAFVLDHGGRITQEDKNSALETAADAGQKDMVELLLDRGADVNAHSGQALHFAVRKGYQAVAEVLLDRHADVNAHCRSMAGWNPPFNNNWETPLVTAIHSDFRSLTAMLLRHGADPEVSETPNTKAVAIAAWDGKLEILKMLLDAEANPNYGLTSAAEDGSAEAVNLLLAHKADPNFSDPKLFNGKLPLQAAAGGANAAMVETLLSHGANPNAGEKDAESPLWLALRRDQPVVKIIELLLNHGADPNRTGFGMTPLGYVRYRAHKAASGEKEPALGPVVPGGPRRPFVPGRSAAAPAEDAAAENSFNAVGELLRGHGALHWLPDPDSIRVANPVTGFSAVVFRRGTNDWNQFTLLETLLSAYDSQDHFVYKEPGTAFNQFVKVSELLPTPDFGRITIMRRESNGTNERRLPVNLLDSSNQLDRTRNAPLQFGDVVEVPERLRAPSVESQTPTEAPGRPPALGPQSQTLTDLQSQETLNALEGHAQLRAHGQTTNLTFHAVEDQSTLESVLEDPASLGMLTSSSDLSRVKVIRRDPAGGPDRVWVVDLSHATELVRDITQPVRFPRRLAPPSPQPAPHPQVPNLRLSTELRVRDGDVIEVPNLP